MESEHRVYQLMDLLRLTKSEVIHNEKYGDSIVQTTLLTVEEIASIKAQLFLELGVNLERQ